MHNAVLIAAFAFLILFSGCTQQPTTGQPVCGNSVCEQGETFESCPADCSQSQPPPLSAEQKWAPIKAEQDKKIQVSGGWQQPLNLGKPINTTGWEDSAYISPDGSKLYFAYSNINPWKLPTVAEIGPNRDQAEACSPPCGQYPRVDTFYSEKASGNFSVPVPHPLTIDYPVLGLVFANDNKAYFHMEKEDGLKTELYFAEKANGAWGAPQKIVELSSAYYDDDPYVNPGDSEMFFQSGRPGPFDFKKENIFYSEKVGGIWQAPQLLPAPINSDASDMQPFLFGGELYFMSDRDGKATIYKSKRLGGNSWAEPEAVIVGPYAVGEPTLTADGKQLYFLNLYYDPELGYNPDIMVAEKK
jgi:hypothetical protein